MENLISSRIELFLSEPLIVSPSAPISEVIGTLRSNDSYQVFIQKERKVGVITIREILKASNIGGMKAANLMIPTPKLSPTDTVKKAAELMTYHRLRVLPVFRKDRLEGAVNIHSLCQAIASLKEAERMKVSNVMTSDLLTIKSEDSISKARNIMIKKGLDHLPVLKFGKLVGILTSDHIVSLMIPKEGVEMGARIGESSRFLSLKVNSIMDKNVATCDVRDDITSIIREMITHKRTYTIVKLWDELQGIVTFRDFVKILTEPTKAEVPVYIVGLPEDPFEAEAAKIKLVRVANTLCKIYSNILEVRSTIKTGKEPSEEKRRRYEVNVTIKTTRRTYIFTESGWELPSIFDSISDKIKRLFIKRPSRKKKERLKETL